VSSPLPVNSTGFIIPPRLYDFLKYVALVVLPAVSALILGLGVTLNWSGAAGIAGIITLIDTFLGAILGKSASNFKQQEPIVFGDIVIQQEPDGRPVGMRIVGHHENFVFEDQSQVVLNVRREQTLE
jgi:Putative phage holin Dp-1